MRTLRKTLILSLAFGFSLLALSLTTAGSTSAETENTASTDNYVYIAKSGDSYTELARSSVIKYDQSNNEIELNAAQVTAAETWVTQEAGSPAINLGSEVSVSKASVEKFAKQAASLDDATKARWQKYADVSSISNGELKDKVLPTVSEDQAAAENNTSESSNEEQDQTSENTEEQNSEESKTEESKDENKKSSKRWIVIAIVVLLVLAALTLIRSSNAKDE